MGLDAWVCCNCIKEGKAPAHPFPELLAFDETGEAILRKEGEISPKLWLAHDKWYSKSCSHSGRLISKHLGNIAAVGHVREFLERNSSNNFPLFLERVVYGGAHSGDCIPASDASQLLTETLRLQGMTSDLLILQFTSDVAELAEASIGTGNPIVF